MSNYREVISEAVKVLRGGGVILYPTDTIWGLGCDATNATAVEKVFGIKERSDSKSMLVLLSNINDLGRYVKEVPEIALDLVEASDKPITVIYPEGKNLASGLIAEDGSVGIRVTSDDFCIELIDRFRKPIVSSSANKSGQMAPPTFMDISDAIKKAVDYIVPLRQDESEKKSASSIIKLEVDGRFKIIR
jgi:L-threonylcarbamoyladenylate synthase